MAAHDLHGAGGPPAGSAPAARPSTVRAPRSRRAHPAHCSGARGKLANTVGRDHPARHGSVQRIDRLRRGPDGATTRSHPAVTAVTAIMRPSPRRCRPRGSAVSSRSIRRSASACAARCSTSAFDSRAPSGCAQASRRRERHHHRRDARVDRRAERMEIGASAGKGHRTGEHSLRLAGVHPLADYRADDQHHRARAAGSRCLLRSLATDGDVHFAHRRQRPVHADVPQLARSHAGGTANHVGIRVTASSLLDAPPPRSSRPRQTGAVRVDPRWSAPAPRFGGDGDEESGGREVRRAAGRQCGDLARGPPSMRNPPTRVRGRRRCSPRDSRSRARGPSASAGTIQPRESTSRAGHAAVCSEHPRPLLTGGRSHVPGAPLPGAASPGTRMPRPPSRRRRSRTSSKRRIARRLKLRR